MNFFKKIWSKLKEPKAVFLTVFYILFALTLAGTIVLVCINQNQSVWHYVLYCLSAIGLAYCIYTIVYLAPKVQEKIIKFLQRHKFTNKLLSNYGYRTIIFSTFSFTLNVAYVVFMGVLAIMTRSAWYISITAYYIVLILMKGNVLYFKYAERKHNKKHSSALMKRQNTLESGSEIDVAGVTNLEEFDSEKRQAKTFRYCGAMFIFLTLALSGIIVLIYTSNMYFEYAGLLIYAVATFTFYRLTLSIINLFKARKQDDLYVQSIRNINLASALVSIVVLQVALFQAFSPESNTSIANGLTGGVVSLVILVLGIYMIVKANQLLKNKKTKEKNNG